MASRLIGPVLAAALLGTPIPVTSAAAADGMAPGSRAMRLSVRPARARTCDRPAVGDCQTEARTEAIGCDAFHDRLGCVDRVLGELSTCWAGTGCF